MGFPTRACKELTSDDAMKQSLRLVKDVSLSMSWNAESLPAESGYGKSRQDSEAEASFKEHNTLLWLRNRCNLVFEIYRRVGKL